MYDSISQINAVSGNRPASPAASLLAAVVFLGWRMHVLFVDESGDTSPLRADDDQNQPVLVVLGLSIASDEIATLTRQWVALKRRFYPGLLPKGSMPWDWQTAELKGTDIRRSLRSKSRRDRRGAVGFVDRSVELLSQVDARFAARVWIKVAGGTFDGRAVYTTSIQWLCERFQAHLSENDSHGLVIADHRNPAPNVNVAHSVFTQRVRSLGDPYPNLVEVPVFGHSDNHAGLQIADLLASALLAPMCCHAFLRGHLKSRHVYPEAEVTVQRYLPMLLPLMMSPPPKYGPAESIVVHNDVSQIGFPAMRGLVV